MATFTVRVRRYKQGWFGEVPTLPGCISEGKTKQALLSNMREAISLYLEAITEDRQARGQRHASKYPGSNSRYVQVRVPVRLVAG